MVNKIYEINQYIYLGYGILIIIFIISLVLLVVLFAVQYIESRNIKNLLKILGSTFLLIFFFWLFSDGIFDDYREIRDYKDQISSGNGKIVTGKMMDFEKEIGRNVYYYFTVDNVRFELRCSPLIQIKEFFCPDKTLHKEGQMLKVYYVETDEEYYETGNVIVRIESYL